MKSMKITLLILNIIEVHSCTRFRSAVNDSAVDMRQLLWRCCVAGRLPSRFAGSHHYTHLPVLN